MNLLQLAPCFKPLHFLDEWAQGLLLLITEAFISMIIAVFGGIYKGQFCFTALFIKEEAGV